jgi:hypothetical protein
MVISRNPSADDRPTFCDITQELQKSDFHLLKWSAKDISSYDKEMRTIGSPLELGEELYKELQSTYIMQTESLQSCK